MVDLTTERSFWQVKAEYPTFAAFLADVSRREDHVRQGRGRQMSTCYRAGTAWVRLLEDGGALINIFRDINTLTDCGGCPFVWGNGAELVAMQARYGGSWTDAVDCCYLDEKYQGLVWQPHWQGDEAQDWAMAWRYVWDAAELDRALMAAWSEQPELDPLDLYAAVWPKWFAALPPLGADGGEKEADQNSGKILAGNP